jgi:peptide/nickel transport system permease protein
VRVLQYIVQRILQFIPLVVVISVLTFALIELPPGDYLTMYILQLQRSGTQVSEDVIARLTRQYGLDKPVHTRYMLWMWNIIRYGNFGRSFQWDKPVREVIGERLMLTIVVSITTLIFVWGVGIPIGIYAATHQYSILDYVLTFVGFIGVSVPSFLLALVLMYVALAYLDISVTGLFSPEYIDAPWSWGRVWDMFQRLWVPVIVIGMSGTAGLIRVMRGTLLDELRKPYVTTARAKGLSERKLLAKYPVRIAINPMISTIGWLLPGIVSGSAIVSIVLNLPTTGPVLLRALMYQDMYLAGSFVMMLSVLTITGTLLSDILLAFLDPRIRYGSASL